MIVLSVIGYAAALAAVYFALRRAHALAWVAFGALPLLLTPLWVGQEHATFMWFKVYSVQAGALLVLALRRTALGSRPWARAAICGVLGANILEAVVLDGLHGHPVNALAGVALIAAMPRPSAVTVAADGDLSFPLSRAWVLGYALWNLAFLLLEFPAYAAIQIALLVPPTVLGLASSARWLQVRSYTFAAHMLLAFSRWDLFEPYERPTWRVAPIGGALQFVAAAACGLALASAIGERRSAPMAVAE